MKKLLALVMVVVFATVIFASEADSVKNLTQEEGLIATKVTLSEEQTAAVQAAMDSKQTVETEYTIYEGKEMVVVMESQRGKWAPIKIAVAINKADRKVKGIEIISMSEKRGAGIKTGSFLGQFTGKTALDEVTAGKDIKAISGATVSSRAMATAVKRALIVYDIAMPAAKKAEAKKK